MIEVNLNVLLLLKNLRNVLLVIFKSSVSSQQILGISVGKIIVLLMQSVTSIQQYILIINFSHIYTKFSLNLHGAKIFSKVDIVRAFTRKICLHVLKCYYKCLYSVNKITITRQLGNLKKVCLLY